MNKEQSVALQQLFGSILNAKKSKTKLEDITVSKDEAIQTGVLFETQKEMFYIFDSQLGYWRPALDKWEAVTCIEINYFDKKEKDRPSSRESLEFIRKYFRIPSLDSVRRKWEANLLEKNIFCLYFKNKAYTITKISESEWEYKEISLDTRKKHLINKWLDIESTVPFGIRQINPDILKIELVYQIQSHLPELGEFLIRGLDYKSSKMKNAIVNLVLKIQALLFYKNMANLKEKITLQKLILLIGTGGTSKSSIMRFYELSVYLQDIISSELNHLNQRFESSALRDRTLIQLNDEDSVSGDRRKAIGHRFMSSAIKTLTGGDLKRVEEKFKTPTMFRNYGFVIGTTNSSLTMANPADFSAMKRRLVPFYFNREVPLDEQNTAYVEKLFATNLEELFFLYIINFQKHSQMQTDIKKFDFETTLYDYKEEEFYQSQSSPLSGFLHEILLPSGTMGPKIDLTIAQIKMMFTQYLVFRPNSTIEVTNLDEFINQFKKLIQKPVVKTFPMSDILEHDFLPLPGVPQIYNTNVNSFEESIKEHLRFFKNKPLSKPETLRRRYEALIEDEPVILRAQTRVYKNVSINWDWFTKNGLEDDFQIPVERTIKEINLSITRNSTAQITKKTFCTTAIDRRCFSTSIINNSKNYIKEQIDTLQNLKEEVFNIIKENESSKDLGCPFENQINLLNKVDFNLDTEKYQFSERELEQQIIKGELKKRKLNFDRILMLKQKFCNEFGQDLGSLLYKNFVESICYQATQVDVYSSEKEPAFEMVLNPFLSQIFMLVYKHIYPKGKDIKNLQETWDFSFEIETINKKIEDHKKIRPKTKKEKEKWPEKQQIEYEKILKQLQKVKENIKKKQKTRIKNENSITRKAITGQEKIFEDHILKVIKILFELEFTIETKKKYVKGQMKTIRFIQFPEGELHDWFEVWADLSNKPMIEPPHSYILSENKNTVGCGGYSILNQLQIGRLFLTEELTTIHYTNWDQKLINEINLIQAQHSKLHVGMVIPLINLKRDFFLSEIKNTFKVFYEKPENDVKTYYANLTIKKIRKILYNIFRFLRFCKMLLWILRDYPFCKVYFPIHLDRSFRLHVSGELNFVNSKDLRLLLIFDDTEFLKTKKELEDKNFQWFLNCQKEKLKKKNQKPNSEKEPRSLLKQEYYLLYQKEQKFHNFSKAAWFDATSSSLQIQCLLFGLVEYIEDLNLREQPYTDIISKWAQEIDLNDLKLATRHKNEIFKNRNVLKMEVMIQLYGGTFFSTLNRIGELETFQGNSNEEKDLRTKISKTLNAFVFKKLNFILEFYAFIKDYHRFLFKQQTDLVTFKNYGCIHQFKHVPTVERILSFKTDFGDKSKRFKITIDVPVTEKIDIKRTLNILPPLLVHSIDSAIARKIRLHFLNKYGINIVSVHDSFAIPAALLDEAQFEYKKALFEYSFDSCPFEPFCIDIQLVEQNKDLINRYNSLKNQIKKNKANPEWQKIRNEISPYCLYPE